MRLGSVLALVTLLASAGRTLAEDYGGLRCLSHCIQASYDVAPDWDDGDPLVVAPGIGDPAPIDDVDLSDPQSAPTAANWGPFPRLPGLRGVRGLTGVIGNLMQTNPHLGAAWYPDQPVAGQPTKLGIVRDFFQFSAPIWSDGDDTLVFSSHVQSMNVSTGAILPTTHTPFPSQLWNIWVGTNYFHVYDNGVIGAALFEGGSASDKPFSSGRVDSAAGTGLLIIPQGDHDAWILGIQASTNSQVFYNLPIPGAAYLYSPSDEFQAIMGFPYSAINYQPFKDYRFQFLYMFLTTVHARAIYQPCVDWQLYAGFDWSNENYSLANRQASDQRFFYYEKRVLAGWQWWWSRHLAIEVAAGYAFDRYFVENNGFSLSLGGTNRVDVGSGPFVTLQMDYRF